MSDSVCITGMICFSLVMIWKTWMGRDRGKGGDRNG